MCGISLDINPPSKEDGVRLHLVKEDPWDYGDEADEWEMVDKVLTEEQMIKEGIDPIKYKNMMDRKKNKASKLFVNSGGGLQVSSPVKEEDQDSF